MTDTAESLDPLRLPLQGERLIEASAGTGKTFTIAALYLRLLLGLGGQAAFPRPLSVEELLVVTFTEAPPLSCAAVSVPIFMNCVSPVCAKARITHSTRACWKRLPINSRPHSGCFWLNGKWTRPLSSPSTVFASAC